MRKEICEVNFEEEDFHRVFKKYQSTIIKCILLCCCLNVPERWGKLEVRRDPQSIPCLRDQQKFNLPLTNLLPNTGLPLILMR